MNQDNEEEVNKNTHKSEDIHEIQPSMDVKQEKFKMKNVKEENEYKKKLSDISPPKVRRIIHKIMLKYHNDPFYTTLDIAKKILKRLKVSNTPYFVGRIKRHMDKWINDNVSDDDDEDSSDEFNKKKSKDVQKDKKNKIKATENIEDISSDIEILLDSESAKMSKMLGNNITSKDKVKTKKEIPLIDLTLDLKEEMKNEVITIIDESTHNNSDKINSTSANEGLPMIPYPIIPGYNPNIPLIHPGQFYQPFYPSYHDVNMYNPYILSYSQYPFNPYFYSPSDFLPSYPVDETGNNLEVINHRVKSQPTDPKNPNIGSSKTAEGSGSKQP